MNATEYNEQAIGRKWTMADLPGGWPGMAILDRCDWDDDGILDADEIEEIDWISFTNAVQEFQGLYGIKPDGKLGPKTLVALKDAFYRAGDPVEALYQVNNIEFRRAEQPTAAPINEVVGRRGMGKKIATVWNNYGMEIAKQADQFSLPIETALAVFCVEAGGRAYDPKSGLIIIRVETIGRWPNGENDFRQRYGTGQGAEWKALADWASKDQRKAFEKASWGLPQLMGFNFEVTPYDSPEDMALAFQRSCVAQISGFFGFIDNNGLAGYIRNHNWKAFVRRYNGPGQVEYYSGVLKKYLSAIESMKVNGAVFK